MSHGENRRERKERKRNDPSDITHQGGGVGRQRSSYQLKIMFIGRKGLLSKGLVPNRKKGKKRTLSLKSSLPIVPETLQRGQAWGGGGGLGEGDRRRGGIVRLSLEFFF